MCTFNVEIMAKNVMGCLLIAFLFLGNFNGAFGKGLAYSGEHSRYDMDLFQEMESSEETVPTPLSSLFRSTNLDKDGQLTFNSDVGAWSEEDADVQSTSPDSTIDFNVLGDRSNTDVTTMKSSSAEFEDTADDFVQDPLNVTTNVLHELDTDVAENNSTAEDGNISVIVAEANSTDDKTNGVLLTSNMFEQNEEYERLQQELQKMRHEVDRLKNEVHDKIKTIDEQNRKIFKLELEYILLKRMTCGQTTLENEQLQLEVANNSTLPFFRANIG